MGEPANVNDGAKGSLWSTIKAVGWGLVGIRKRSGFESDLVKINPLHLIVVGLVTVLVIVVALIVVVNWVVAK